MKNSAYKNAYQKTSQLSTDDQSPVEQVSFLYDTLSKQFDLLSKSIESKNAIERVKINEKIHNIILALSSFWDENPINESVKLLIDTMEEVNRELLYTLIHINEREDSKKAMELSKGIKNISSLWSF